MSRKPQSKDEALEALDFIVNVLKEHEKDLDKLIGELATVTEQIGATSELTGKVEKIEQNVTGLQSEISNLVNCLTTQPPQTNQTTPITSRSTRESSTTTRQLIPAETNLTMQPNHPLQPETMQPTQPQQTPYTAVQSVQPSVIQNPPVILRCKQWEDFQTLAFQAQTMSFMIKEAEHTFQVDALKGNQIITYTGELQKVPVLLKAWLTKQLSVDEKKVLEGVLAIG